MRRWATGAPLALAAAAALVQAAAAAGAPPSAVDLRAQEGIDGWTAASVVVLRWAIEPASTAVPEQVEYTIRRAGEAAVLRRRRLAWKGNQLAIANPAGPGRYRVEVRLGAGGAWGPWTAATTLFDDTRPGPPRPRAEPGWNANPVWLTVGPPAEPLSPSGIRGYAVSVHSHPHGSPCAATERCADAEIDIPGGGAERRLALGALNEGTHYVNVVAVSGAGLASDSVSTIRVDVDATVPEVVLSGPPEGWSDGPVRLRANASDRLAGMGAGGAASPFTAIAVDGAAPTVAGGDSVSATVSGSGIHLVEFYARDAAGNVGDGQAGSPLPRSQLVRIDAEPPRVRFLAHTDRADPERIEAVVADRLSGAAARGTIAVRPVGSGARYDSLPTEAAAGRLVARWDSDSGPVGNYEFRATGYDRAGNASRSSLRADGARMVLANRLRARVAVRFGFGGKRLIQRRCERAGAHRRCRREAIEAFDRRPARRQLRYGRRVPVSGVLTRAGGEPLRGRRVTVVESLSSGAVRTTAVRTAADGSFSARLAAGPSRAIEARFDGDRVLARARGKRLRLTVRSGVRLGAVPATARIGGAPVRFRGRVGGGGIPPEGLSVELQFRLPGLPWSDFRTVRTDHRGRFRYAYAFTDDDSRGVRFLFRAHVPAQPAWPYAAGSSLPVAVTGR